MYHLALTNHMTMRILPHMAISENIPSPEGRELKVSDHILATLLNAAGNHEGKLITLFFLAEHPDEHFTPAQLHKSFIDLQGESTDTKDTTGWRDITQDKLFSWCRKSLHSCELPIQTKESTDKHLVLLDKVDGQQTVRINPEFAPLARSFCATLIDGITKTDIPLVSLFGETNTTKGSTLGPFNRLQFNRALLAQRNAHARITQSTMLQALPSMNPTIVNRILENSKNLFHYKRPTTNRREAFYVLQSETIAGLPIPPIYEHRPLEFADLRDVLDALVREDETLPRSSSHLYDQLVVKRPKIADADAQYVKNRLGNALRYWEQQGYMQNVDVDDSELVFLPGVVEALESVLDRLSHFQHLDTDFLITAYNVRRSFLQDTVSIKKLLARDKQAKVENQPYDMHLRESMLLKSIQASTRPVFTRRLARTLGRSENHVLSVLHALEERGQISSERRGRQSALVWFSKEKTSQE